MFAGEMIAESAELPQRFAALPPDVRKAFACVFRKKVFRLTKERGQARLPDSEAPKLTRCFTLKGILQVR